MMGKLLTKVKNWSSWTRILRRFRIKLSLAIVLVSTIAYYFCLPDALFKDPYSAVLEARGGELLSASIARDGQWRFPEMDTVPEKFVEAIVSYEDKRFFSHPGVDLISMGRALRQNISSGSVISGGSTITMQTVRLSRKKRSRDVWEKMIEMVMATRLELRLTKHEIISVYASHAPFGGNVVGLDAACWRYFGRDSKSLSWGEAALLAVLPNAPALIHPGKNRDKLRIKRDRLLDKLQAQNKIDSLTCVLAKTEPIPGEPLPLPRMARHLLTRATHESDTIRAVHSTIDYNLQLRIEQIVELNHQRLMGNLIHNAAVLVADVTTGEVLAYVGNIDSPKEFDGAEVDIITSPRSTGSILKPFLYAAMLDEGKILPRTLIPDFPVFINGFSPRNFSKNYDGMVHADQALIRSLNIPAVHLLRDYRYEKFHALLKSLGMTTLRKSPDHYGLSLILGGAEGTLWDICGMYASMSRTLNNYFEHPGKNRYDPGDIHPLCYERCNERGIEILEETSKINAASLYLTFDALKELYRPGEESGWKMFESSKKVAWKTGTSFGFRDGWAIGITPRYVVGVWAGNADGEGRPGLTGTEAAAPLMFEIFAQLNDYTWFRRPLQEMEQISICSQSGLRSTTLCSEVDTVWVPTRGLQTATCPYHKRVYLATNGRERVHSNCERIDNMVESTWFVLPPVPEYYFKNTNAGYRPLPPYRRDCIPPQNIVSLDLIYPRPNARIFIPRDISGKPGVAVFHAAHRDPNIEVFWHLDGHFMGVTKTSHKMGLNPAQGKHTLTLVDGAGESIEHVFEVLSTL
jgi:penicillin-binding protein 1C